jgi:hypothetical protein
MRIPAFFIRGKYSMTDVEALRPWAPLDFQPITDAELKALVLTDDELKALVVTDAEIKALLALPEIPQWFVSPQ